MSDYEPYQPWTTSIKKPGIYKYVRVGDEFRFADPMMYQHSELVKEGEEPISAGSIAVHDDHFYFSGYGSMTLNLGWKEEDQGLMEKTLGVKFEHEARRPVW